LAHDTLSRDFLDVVEADLFVPVERDRAIAATIKGDLQHLARYLQNVLKADAEWVLDLSLHREAIGGRVQSWRALPVVPYEKQLIGHDVLLQGHWWRRKRTRSKVGRNELGLWCDGGLGDCHTRLLFEIFRLYVICRTDHQHAGRHPGVVDQLIRDVRRGQ